MGLPSQPEIAGFTAPRGGMFQTPYYGPNPMIPFGPGGKGQVIHIPGGLGHSGFLIIRPLMATQQV